MGLLDKALALLRRGRETVGGDVFGNVYFTHRQSDGAGGEVRKERGERISLNLALSRSRLTPPSPFSYKIVRRMVRTPTGTNPYAYDSTAIAPEWVSWLRGTRADPPSPEEAAAAAAARERARALGTAAAEARAAKAAAQAAPVRLTRQLGEGKRGAAEK
jgi:NADH:ubiquinone oxidoreductase subunit